MINTIVGGNKSFANIDNEATMQKEYWSTGVLEC